MARISLRVRSPIRSGRVKARDTVATDTPASAAIVFKDAGTPISHPSWRPRTRAGLAGPPVRVMLWKRSQAQLPSDRTPAASADGDCRSALAGRLVDGNDDRQGTAPVGG